MYWLVHNSWYILDNHNQISIFVGDGPVINDIIRGCILSFRNLDELVEVENLFLSKIVLAEKLKLAHTYFYSKLFRTGLAKKRWVFHG